MSGQPLLYIIYTLTYIIDVYKRQSKFLRSLRRTNALYTDMSIIFIDRWLYVDISPSRIIRPVLIVNETQQLVMVEKNLQNSSIHDLVINGAIEYISAWEQEYIKVATSFKQIEERRRLFDDAANTVDVYKRQ